MYGKWFYMLEWPRPMVEPQTIMALEAAALVSWLEFACALPQQTITGTRFIFKCDNEPFVETVLRGRSSHPVFSVLLDKLHTLQCHYSFDLYPMYVRSEDNPLADALSRNDLPDFYARMYEMHGLLPCQLEQVDMSKRLLSLTSTMNSLLN